MAVSWRWTDSIVLDRDGCVPVFVSLPGPVLLPEANRSIHMDGGGSVSVGGGRANGTSQERADQSSLGESGVCHTNPTGS